VGPDKGFVTNKLKSYIDDTQTYRLSKLCVSVIDWTAASVSS
jgi:hypothetical protein